MTSAVTTDMVGLDDITTFAERVVIPAVGGASLSIATAAMLMVIICSIRRDIEGNDLADAIQDVTAYLVTRLAPVEGRAN